MDPAWEQPTKLGLHWILLIGSLLLIPPDHDRLISPALGHLIHNTLRGYAGVSALRGCLRLASFGTQRALWYFDLI